MPPRQLSSGHYIPNGNEDCGGDEGKYDRDEGVTGIVTEEVVVTVVKEEEIMKEIVETEEAEIVQRRSWRRSQ